ncbi:MAG: OsmC family peroxiredoxin [Gemmatimonadales bacterium]|nr:OsmC family peroxiredoxin [Gemmatimonadales bacterium]
MPTSNATAVWEGGLKGGRGHFKADSAAFEGDYSFTTRFEGSRGTNPEELIAAAHAACFSMALSAGLEKSGTPASRVNTKASCTLEKVGDGFKITKMRLQVVAKVPGVDQAGFAKAADAAKQGCPVSGALQGNVAIEMEARLE